MTPVMISTMVLCFALTVSVAVSIGLASILGIQVANANMLIAVKEMFASINKFPLAAIPFFILAGNLMETGGISRRLVEFAKSIVGGVQGGLPMTCVLTCMIFAAVSGSSVATTFAIGAILIPALIKHGYPTNFAAALQATSAELGVIIPPSIPMILYGVSAEVSIGELFIAGFGPGILIGGGLMAFVWLWSQYKGYGKDDHIGRMTFGHATKEAALALMMPVIIIGGILTGVFTATEAAGVASLYAMVVCLFVFHTITWRDLPDIILNMVKVSAMIALILGTSKGFSWVLTTQNIPQYIGGVLTGLTDSPVVFLMLVNIILLVIGCLVDTYPAILIFAPIFHPIALSYGIHPLHFGVVMCVNLLIGLNTPPVGTGLFLGVAIGKVSLEELVKAVMPFNLVEMAVLLVLTYVPTLSLWLPSAAGFR